MNEGSSKPGPSAPRYTSAPPLWQSALVAVSLALFVLLVVAPVSGTALIAYTGIVLWGSAQGLNSVGALDAGAFEVAAYLSAVVLSFATGAWTFRKLRSLWRPASFAAASTQGSWAVRHPWLTAAAVCGVIDFVLVPLDRARIVDIPDAIVGAGILTTAALAEIAAVYLVARGLYLSLRAIWRLTRRSPFAAGAVAAGSLSAALAAYLFASALAAIGSLLAASTPAAPSTPCTKSAMTCSRELLTSAARLPTSTPGLPAPEPRTAFSACVEELHRDDPQRGNAYLDALKEAERRTPNPEEAKDVVHDTLVEVCLAAERIADVRSYFYRSVMNNVGKSARRYRRYCPLVPEPVDWPVDGCVVRSVESQYIQAELQASAHDAMCSLDRGDRSVIVLRVWENLPYQEIGQQLGLTEAAARQRYHRALDALRSEFSARCR